MRRDIIVLGASAGGVEALSKLLGSLPWKMPASFFVVLHVAPASESYLPRILQRAGPLEARHPADQERVRQGVIYVAPPDFHLLLQGEHVRLSHGPKENRHRPSIDVLFRSAALSCGPRVAGILLTGNLDDGVAGLVEIQKLGGVAIVQDPTEAAYPEMPRRALEAMQTDHCLPLRQIARMIVDLVKKRGGADMRKPKHRPRKAARATQALPQEIEQGTPVPLVCPECQGPLWEFKHGKLSSYQCLVGHRYNLESFLAAHGEELEQALWVALRTLEERATLQQHLAENARARKNSFAAENFTQRADKNAGHAKLLRKILEDLPGS